MNNQNILKFITPSRKPIFYYFIKQQEQEQQEQQDREITLLYINGYFNPWEYVDYLIRRISYQAMMNRHASRMNDDYYYHYVEEMYYDGYLEYSYAEDYVLYYYAFDNGFISYDTYIRELERALKRINYNILKGGIDEDYPDEPEEDYPEEPEE